MALKTNAEIRILFADPDEGLRAAAQRALERQGFSVELASDGADALARFAKGQYDVVIASVLMPRRDGLEVLRQIRTSSPQTQVILLADASSIGSANLGLRDGAFTYLVKPIQDLRQLTPLVERAAELEQLRGSPVVAPVAPPAAPLPPSPPPVSPPPVVTPPPVLIRRVGDMIRSGDRVTDVLPGLLESCTSLFQAPHAIVLLSRPQVGLQLDRAFGYGDAASAAHDFGLYIGDEFAWRVATDRKTLRNDSPSHPSIGTPLVSGDQLLGILAVYPVAEEAADAKRIALFESLAADASIALEMSRLIDENDRLSPIDPLTSALKQATFMDMADREFRRSWRFDQPLTAILLDVDGMHDINSKNGRAVGDEVLRHVASACRSTIRAFDLIARYDQDTFAILLVMADQTGGRTAAERIRMAVGSMDVRDAAGSLRVTASFGVCSYPHDGCASIFDLLDLAQSALKAARRQGTNQLSVA